MGRSKIDINKDLLYELYINKNFTPAKIGKKFNCSFSTVTNRLQEYNISLKDPSYARVRYARKDFNGTLEQKAYIIGFRIGDLNVYKPSANSHTIVVRCHSTQIEQVNVIKSLFKGFGKITVSLRRGHFHINCFLNDSFSYLLTKDFNAWEWIRNQTNERVSFAFIAGYTDAEGNFILNQGKARFKIDSYDFDVLKWISEWLTKNGVANKFRCIYKQGEGVNGCTYVFKKDLWRLNINEMSAIKKFILSTLPLFRHKIRIQDAKKSLKNINDRTKQ